MVGVDPLGPHGFLIAGGKFILNHPDSVAVNTYITFGSSLSITGEARTKFPDIANFIDSFAEHTKAWTDVLNGSVSASADVASYASTATDYLSEFQGFIDGKGQTLDDVYGMIGDLKDTATRSLKSAGTYSDSLVAAVKAALDDKSTSSALAQKYNDTLAQEKKLVVSINTRILALNLELARQQAIYDEETKPKAAEPGQPITAPVIPGELSDKAKEALEAIKKIKAEIEQLKASLKSVQATIDLLEVETKSLATVPDAFAPLAQFILSGESFPTIWKSIVDALENILQTKPSAEEVKKWNISGLTQDWKAVKTGADYYRLHAYEKQ